MKPIISKTPTPPELTERDIKQLTEITFGKRERSLYVMPYLYLVELIKVIGRRLLKLIKMALLQN